MHYTNMFDILNVFQRYDIEVRKAHLSAFSNGCIAYTINLGEQISDEQWSAIKKSVNLKINVSDQTFIRPYLRSAIFTAEEAFYLTAATRFLYYFMNNPNDDFE